MLAAPGAILGDRAEQSFLEGWGEADFSGRMGTLPNPTFEYENESYFFPTYRNQGEVFFCPENVVSLKEFFVDVFFLWDLQVQNLPIFHSILRPLKDIPRFLKEQNLINVAELGFS